MFIQIGAGTDANVFIIIYGNNGKSTPKLKLAKKEGSGDSFEKGKKDLFKFRSTNVGEISKINISHDGKGIYNFLTI
jgi:hypothetical protein